MVNKNRVEYLESLLPKTVKLLDGGIETIISVEKKYRANFEKYARYEGNGIYQWKGLRANDTAELYLIGVLSCENIPYERI